LRNSGAVRAMLDEYSISAEVVMAPDAHTTPPDRSS
jgi:hypothetical protein